MAFDSLVILIGGVALYTLVSHILSYHILKKRHLRSRKWDLNIGCGGLDGGGVNADVVERNLPNFVRVKDIYTLPFRDGQFDHVLSSHTIEHLDDPDRFYRELRRVGKNVTLLVPPVWDLAALLYVAEHKWHFLSPRTRHDNNIPKRVRLPYWVYQKRFGQRVK
jgi:SAM-dependent methyltransferase